MRKDRQTIISHIPNMITSLRLFGVIALLFVRPLSPAFFIIYTVCGISDVVDGFAARMLHCTSEFGAKLDSVSDMLFYMMMLVRVFPALLRELPEWIWIYVGAILAVRLASYITAAVKYRRFASVHTYLNKATGFSVFLLPYLIKSDFFTAYSFAVCTVAMLASCEELVIHLTENSYNANRKSIIIK